MNRIAISFGDEAYFGSMSALERSYKKYDLEFQWFTGEWFIDTELGKYSQYHIPRLRGFYYWIWKPFIILEALQFADEVLYTDAAVLCKSNPNVLFDHLNDTDIINLLLIRYGQREIVLK